jgi:signal transduction histidine kinase
MTWESEPDPVVRAHARAQLRAALSQMQRQYAASLDREMATLRARQQSLKDQLERQQALSDGLLRTRHAGVCVLDTEGRVLAWSAGAELVTNRAAHDILGTPIGDLLPVVGELLDHHLRDLDRRLAGVEVPIEGTCPLEREPGMPPAELSFRLGILRSCPGPQNEAAVLSLWDVTELQALRARVDEGDRLQAMSRIAGSVAHEIRNPLNSLFLNTDLLEIELGKTGDPPPRVDHLLGIIRQEVEKLNDIVTDYLSLARLSERQRETIDLADFVRDLADECSSWWSERRIRVEAAVGGGPYPVAVDAKQLRRALVNLLTNARDAMPDGGELKLELSTEGEGVELRIADSGTGMGPEDLNRVATPFFTRKEGGTGLGVYLSREILAAHRGRLELESELGRGTTVRVWLPGG